MSYLRIWLALVVLTLVEVALAWVRTAPAAMLALLLALSLVKAALIAWGFMHLNAQRSKGIVLFVSFLFVCIGALLALIPDGIRSQALR